MQNRRVFFKQASSLAAITLMGGLFDAVAGIDATGKRARILLRSSWQTVNIGDIGHTFGIMELFQEYCPGADITLWPASIDNGVDELLLKKYPRLKIAQGVVNKDGTPSTPELKTAFDTCQLMVHGSGAWVVAKAELQAWWSLTQKPFGIYGISLEEADAQLVQLLTNASFFYARDTTSLKFVRSLGLKCPIIDFAPDATFALDLANEEKAKSYLRSVNLKEGEFICAIPRLRYTPYFQMRNKKPTPEEERRYTVSMKYKEADAAKLREVMIRWVRETGLKVLACPEVTYQVELAKEVLVNPLPGDVKRNVVWRDTYWNPDEAGSVYAKARALVSYELHSPIIAFTRNVPSIHLKQPTDTTKGQMWRDIGFPEWVFEIEDTSGKQISDALLNIHHNYPWALNQIKAAKSVVKSFQKKSMNILQKSARP